MKKNERMACVNSEKIIADAPLQLRKKVYVSPIVEHRIVEVEHQLLAGSVAPDADKLKNSKEEVWMDEDTGFNQDFWV